MTNINVGHPSASRTRNMAPTPKLNISTSAMFKMRLLFASRCFQMSAPMQMKFPATKTNTQFWAQSLMLPSPNPAITPNRDMKLMKPLQSTVWMLENPFLIRIPTSPISRGISWAMMAITIGVITAISPEAKPTPMPKPSKKLWTKEESRFKYPAVPFPLRFSKQVFFTLPLVPSSFLENFFCLSSNPFWRLAY